MRGFFDTELAVVGGQAHALAAADEMRELANELRTILRRTGVRSPANDRAYAAIAARADHQAAGDRWRALPAGIGAEDPNNPGCAGAGPIFEGPLMIAMFSRGQ